MFTVSPEVSERKEGINFHRDIRSRLAACYSTNSEKPDRLYLLQTQAVGAKSN
jgi:hypothetical protein